MPILMNCTVRCANCDVAGYGLIDILLESFTENSKRFGASWALPVGFKLGTGTGGHQDAFCSDTCLAAYQTTHLDW